MATVGDLTLPPAPEAGAPATLPLPWLRPLVAVVVVVLALLSLLELAVAFIERSMPALHFVAGPIGIGVMVILWFAELAGLRWPLVAFAVLATAPNMALAIIGHTGLNFFFLMLTVVWVTYRGSRAEGLAALGLSLSVIGVSAAIGVANGFISLGPWVPWASGPVLGWWATRALVAQQRLATELRASQRDLTWQVDENKRLRAAAEGRLRDVEALYRADEALYGALRTAQVLQALVDVVADVVAAEQSAVLTWDGARPAPEVPGGRPVVAAARGWATEALAGLSAAPASDSIVERVLCSQRPLAITESTTAPDGRTLLFVPILADERVFGVLVVGYGQHHHVTDDEQRLFVALAQRTTLALENARLYEQARQTALLEERQRLARDLHDAVTQTLFATSLLADVLPRLWERDAVEGRRRLAELRELTRGALAEMRTLLYELRPSALTEMPLGDLLRQLVEATIGHARLPIALTVEGQRPLPPEVQVTLYRIAQETLNNVAKHALATRADVALVYHADGVELCLGDDGQGFDADRIPPGHLGVGMMRERAAAVGAGLDIVSRPGQGTRLTVAWPNSGAKEGPG